jgi:hypothetical protein
MQPRVHTTQCTKSRRVGGRASLRGASCPEAYAYAATRTHNAVYEVPSGWGQGVFAWRVLPRSICLCSHAYTQRSVRSPVGFSRTAGLNALPYLVDLHIGCLLVILAGGGGVVGASAACLVRWRRMSCSGLALHVGLPALLVRPTDMGLSLHSPSRHLICRGWDACDRLPV